MGTSRGSASTRCGCNLSFDEAWKRTSNVSVIKCWAKSQCLSPMLQHQARSIIESETDNLIDLTGKTSNVTNTDLDLNDAVSTQEVHNIEEEISAVMYMHSEPSPMTDFLNSVLQSESSGNLHSILNSPAPFDTGRFQDATPNNEILSLFDSAQEHSPTQ
eukprot:IDg3844t1